VAEKHDGTAFLKQSRNADAETVDKFLDQDRLLLGKPRFALPLQFAPVEHVGGLLACSDPAGEHDLAALGFDDDRKSQCTRAPNLGIIGRDEYSLRHRNAYRFREAQGVGLAKT
jgi:hypothetical protein